MTYSMIRTTDEGFCISDEDMDPRERLVGILWEYLHRVVFKMIGKNGICRVIVRANQGAFPDCAQCSLLNGLRIKRFHNGHPGVSRTFSSVLYCDDHLRFVSRSPSSFPGSRTTEKGVVHFDDPLQKTADVPLLHGVPYLMNHQPGSNVVHVKKRLKTFGRTAPFVRDNQINGPKPFSQRKMRAMKQRVCGQRRLTTAPGTFKYLSRLSKICLGMSAFRTRKTARPAQLFQILKTSFFGLKPLLKLEKTDLCVRVHVYPHCKVSAVIWV